MIRFAFLASGLVIAASPAMAQTGIPACDSYFAKWDDCVDRIPEESQNDFAAINGNMRQWVIRRLQEHPEARKLQEQTCRTESAKARKAKSFYEYGCRF